MSTIKKDTLTALLEKLDTLSFGFPKSWLNNDRGLVSKIFDEESAQVFLKMEHGYQTAQIYALKQGISEEEAKKSLDTCCNKGLIFRRHRNNGDEYATFPFVAGFLEWQAKNTNKKWLMQTCLYMVTSNFGKRMSQVMPFYRSVPRHPEMVEGSKILPYDNIDLILNRHKRFAVAPCMCRTMYKMKPFNPCNHPIETCIETDDYADFYIETGIGREITREEARQIIMDGEHDGRVINVTNSKEGENICSCCKCGCGMLYLKTKYPGPSGELWSNYYSHWNEEKCIKCGACYSSCPFGYLKTDKHGNIIINTKLCLGCGLCVGKCKTKALTLLQKSEEKIYVPPETYDDAVEIWEKETVKDYKHGK